MKRLLTLAAGTLLLVPAAARAHGIGEDAVGRSTLEFIPLGMEHMMLGWDHLLFIAGVVLIAGNALRATKLISLFALGHSLTLIIATLAGWQISATLVDVVIALSVVWIGYLRFTRGAGDRVHNWRQVFAIVFVFGLIHGLGLSTRLQELGLSSDGLLGKVIAFNVGVEIGQLTAIGLMVLVGGFVAGQLKDTGLAQRWISATLLPLGVLAGFLVVLGGDEPVKESQPVAERSAKPRKPEVTAGSTPTGECAAREHEPAVFAGGAHPPKTFMEPNDSYSEVDLTHVITDGYVVVRYQPTVPAGDLVKLRALVDESDETILAVPDAKIDGAIAVVASRRTLTCPTVDIDAAFAFATDWVADVRSGAVKPM